MSSKNASPKKYVQLIIGAVFLIFSIILILVQPSTIQNPISIDYEKKTFSGTLPVIILISSVLFFWFGSKEKKDELADSKAALEKATNTISGRLVNLNFRFGDDKMEDRIKNAYKNKKLNGTYSVRNKGEIVKDGKINFYEDALSKTIMAQFDDIPFDNEYLIGFEISDGANTLYGSESLRVRIANLNIQS